MLRITHGLVLLLALVLSGAPARAADNDFSAADTAAIRAYVLTAPKVNSYIAAITTLGTAEASDSALFNAIEAMDNEPGETLDQMRAKLTNHPQVLGYFTREGLTADDAVLLPLVTLYAGIAASFPGADGGMATPAQLNFVQSNGPLLERLGEANDALDGGVPDTGASEPDIADGPPDGEQ